MSSSCAPLYFLENRLMDDDCEVADRDRQSGEAEGYQLANFFPTNAPACNPKVAEVAACHPNLHYRDGFGVLNACNVDVDSDVRLGGRITNSRHRHVYKNRVFQGSGHFYRGPVLPDSESGLIQSDITREKKPCNVVPDTLDSNVFVPLLPCIQQVQQNPDTVIYPWTNGGDNTREWVRDEQYLQSCGYTKDGKGWKRGCSNVPVLAKASGAGWG